MRHYCTYFDSNFLSRGLALYESLCLHEKEFTLYVLCLDDKTHDFFQQNTFSFLIPISLKAFEYGDTKLTDCKADRSRVEYIFTCSPSLPLYILNSYQNIELVTYLDADLFFFSSPDSVFEEIGNSSIAIVAHRFSERNRHREIYGIYNVGFLSFRNDQEGRKCLEWWREKCIEWCFDRAEDGRFADQKYLDTWPDMFNKVCIIEHKGVNLAPWNVDNYDYSISDGALFVDDDPLIVYHFHGLSHLGNNLFRTSLEEYGGNKYSLLTTYGYDRYIKKLKSVSKKYGINLCMTRKDYRYSLISLLLSSTQSDIVCLFSLFPLFNVSRAILKLQSIMKCLRFNILINLVNGKKGSIQV